ncbi:HAMP domain-containing sensor histidine kinase [Spirillospora sp. NPDC046719]
MRSRAALAATAVVAVALVAAGLTVLLTLRGSLTRQSDLQAEIIAREVAAQVAVGTPVTRLDLPDSEDHPVQVVDEHGRVVAVSKDLDAISGTGSSSVAPNAAPTATSTGGDDDGGHDDHGGRGERPGRGEVSTDVDYGGGRATVGHDTADYRFAAVAATAPSGGTVVVHAGARLATQAVGSVTRAMLLGLPLLLLVVGAVTWLVTRRALRPVEAIRAEMAAITSAGDLARRVPVPGSRDEVAGLAETTNQTLGALERSVERQRRFVADASHELRSPLASLRTQLEVAAAHPHLLDVDGAVQDVVRLQDLAAGLLLLARLDAGERPRHDRVDLGALVREEVAHRAATDRVPVEVTGTGAFEVLGSAAQLERVLVNLLDNAQRHAASSVGAALSAGGGRVVLRVTDDGPGVPPADRERIFERFVRLDDARARDEGGAGLGLAIARGVARAHGGDLTAAAAPGGGAAFELWLPAAG